MSLFKPVKMQQIILPPPYEFHRLPLEEQKKKLIALSKDNIFYYLKQDPCSRECFTLEQILDEDVRGSGAGADNGSANNWPKQNANRNPDLEASFLEQQVSGFAVPTNSPSGNNRWQNSSGNGSNAYGPCLTPSRPTVERPPVLDLRNGTETLVYIITKVVKYLLLLLSSGQIWLTIIANLLGYVFCLLIHNWFEKELNQGISSTNQQPCSPKMTILSKCPSCDDPPLI